MNDELYDVLKDENKDNVLPDEEEQAWREADAWDHGARFRHLAARCEWADPDTYSDYNPGITITQVWHIASAKLQERVSKGSGSTYIQQHRDPIQFNFIAGVLDAPIDAIEFTLEPDPSDNEAGVYVRVTRL